MIGDYLAQDVWWKKASGTDADGHPTLAAAVQGKARWLHKRRQVLDNDGEQVVSEVTVQLLPGHQVAVGDQLSHDNDKFRTVISVFRPPDLEGQGVLTLAYC